jgi:hypothetical protein
VNLVILKISLQNKEQILNETSVAMATTVKRKQLNMLPFSFIVKGQNLFFPPLVSKTEPDQN